MQVRNLKAGRQPTSGGDDGKESVLALRHIKAINNWIVHFCLFQLHIKAIKNPIC